MTEAADLVLQNAVVHPLDGSEQTFESVAVRDGRIVSVDSDYETDFLVGVGTETVDLAGRHLLPGFVDAHTHLEIVGRGIVEADLSGADSPEACLDRLRALDADHRDDEWLVGFGYDETRWNGEYLTREDLDAVSDRQPVAAFREDIHVVSVNSVALDRLSDRLPAEDVRTEGGEPTGVLVEEALDEVYEATGSDPETMREYLLAAQKRAHERGVTAVHEMVRHSPAPQVYRDLDLAGELTLRVRLNYWADHLDAVLETGLRTNHGSEHVQVGGIKTYVDGSLGGRTARLSEPYADEEDDERGRFLESPADLESLVERIDSAGLQVTLHAIGDEAIGATLDAYEGTEGSRHRIEHAEVLTGDLVERLAAADVVVSAQPNFHKWAGEGGLYDSRIGDERRRQTNQFRALVDAGATLAFGSDCMPLDPLFGIGQAVTAPEPAQRLSVREALRAYTAGAAYAGFDEERMGTVEPGKLADVVVLDESPWEADDIADIDVSMTVVGGDVVYDDR
jgi:predicted amidohydrolase YtcJ